MIGGLSTLVGYNPGRSYPPAVRDFGVSERCW